MVADAQYSAVCHGPAALAYAKLSDGSYLIKGCTINGFSNAEEEGEAFSTSMIVRNFTNHLRLPAAFGFTQYMPFSLEDTLNKNSGGKFEKNSQNWGECVRVAKKGNVTIVTGQNPASGRYSFCECSARKVRCLMLSFASVHSCRRC